MSQPVYEPVIRKPAEWLADLVSDPSSHIAGIRDYDGWQDQSFDTPITEDEFHRRLTDCTLKMYPVAGAASPEWGFDAAVVIQAYGKARQLFSQWQNGEVDRKEFTSKRDAYRKLYDEYVSRWVNAPGAVEYFTSRLVDAPEGWND